MAYLKHIKPTKLPSTSEICWPNDNFLYSLKPMPYGSNFSSKFTGIYQICEKSHHAIEFSAKSS